MFSFNVTIFWNPGTIVFPKHLRLTVIVVFIWRIVITNSKSVLIVIKLVSNNYFYYWHGVYYNFTAVVLTSTWLEKKKLIKHVRKRKRLNGTVRCPSKREVWFSINKSFCFILVLNVIFVFKISGKIFNFDKLWLLSRFWDKISNLTLSL